MSGPLQPAGKAFSVPVFIQTVNRRGDGFGKPDFSRDLRAAIAAQINQLASLRVAVGGHTGDGEDAFQSRTAGHHIAQQIFQPVKIYSGPIRGFDFLLGFALVAAEDVVHARRVAAASCVFQ